jgi:excinuclease ABC subunit C
MKEASIDELANVESMNYKTAETLYNFFRMSKVEKQEALK